VSCWDIYDGQMSLSHQLGAEMSVGRDWEPGMRDGNSFLGTTAAVWAAEKSASRMELFKWIVHSYAIDDDFRRVIEMFGCFR